MVYIDYYIVIIIFLYVLNYVALDIFNLTLHYSTRRIRWVLFESWSGEPTK